MNKQQINVFATRDLSGCICAVYGHLVAAEVGGGVTVDWVDPGDLSPIEGLIYALGVARDCQIELPDVRSIFVCGTAVTQDIRNRLNSFSSDDHEIVVYQFDVENGMFTHRFQSQMDDLLNMLGPDNFVSVMVEFCQTHPGEALDADPLREFVTYASQRGQDVDICQ